MKSTLVLMTLAMMGFVKADEGRLFYPAANATISLSTMNTMLTYGAVIFPTAILILGALFLMTVFGFGDNTNNFRRSINTNTLDSLVDVISNIDKLPQFVNKIAKTFQK